jgi:predicted nuclease of predicted toxin-antitoxin system
MALLADENFPVSVIEGLASAGYDIVSVAQVSPGIADLAVLELACHTGRYLLTFDADFGDLVFFHGATAPRAILYFRIRPIIIDELLAAALRGLAETPEGYFAVVSRESTRLRPLSAVT